MDSDSLNSDDLGLDLDEMTYEELLELGDQIGHVSRGLKKEDIAKLQTRVLAESDEVIVEKDKCAICLEKHKVKTEIRVLPCSHIFHRACIDKALTMKNQCPICRQEAVPVPHNHSTDESHDYTVPPLIIGGNLIIA